MSSATAGPVIAIVGGGFCGTLAAVRLLQDSQGASPDDARLPPDSRIVLIDPSPPGRGIAYRRGPDHWLLNVPAERMSAFADRPNDFLEWAQSRNPRVRGEDFLPRTWYGDYLEARLARACRLSASRVTFEHRAARVVDITAPAVDVTARAVDDDIDGERAHLRLADLSTGQETTLSAHRVLLALGNSPAATAVPGTSEIVIDQPWRTGWIERLPRSAPRVLLIGSGLTMIDTALSVFAARPDARVLALSRRGLLPRAHALHWPATAAAPFAAQNVLGRGPLHARLRSFRRFVSDWSRTGGDWRAALQRVRESMPALWAGLSSADRARFLRHLRTWWDVHRHRAPQATLARIEALRAERALRIDAGRILGARRLDRGIEPRQTVEPQRIEVRWRARGADRVQAEVVHAVVNATGPEADPRRSTCPLVRSLIDRGLCRPDAHGLGWDTHDDGWLLARDGRPNSLISYVGPLLRARHWEATAVPELRGHVDRTARALLRSLAPARVEPTRSDQAAARKVK